MTVVLIVHGGHELVPAAILFKGASGIPLAQHAELRTLSDRHRVPFNWQANGWMDGLATQRLSKTVIVPWVRAHGGGPGGREYLLFCESDGTV